MRYVLGISFYYKKLKKNAKMRIFAGDHLIDEFTVENDIGPKAVVNTDTKSYRYRFLANDKYKSTQDTNMSGPGQNYYYCNFPPKKMSLYEIDESVLQKEIRIECENDDTNYTNGFMTKWSYVQFYYIFLMPKSLFNKKRFLRVAKMLTMYNKKGNPDRIKYDPVQIGDHYIHWPSAEERHIESISDYEGELWWHKIGGSFKIHFPLRKKYKTVFFGSEYPFKRLVFDEKMIDTMALYKLLNMYNEDN